MAKKILLVLTLLILAFLFFVNSRPNSFRYERSGVINASPEKIYPYLSNFKLGAEWNPYEKKDPNMAKVYLGAESGVGAKMTFAGNKDVGEGELEILKAEPNSLIEMRLTMLKPFKASNTVQYQLTPEGSGTRFTWAMFGEANFFSKLIGVLIDCDKMMGKDMETGISSLKALVESK